MERNTFFGGLLVSVIAIALFAILMPNWIRARNAYRAELTVAHMETDLATLQRLEDQARATISQWIAAYQRWIQFKDSDRDNERDWANAALMQANNLAATFNTFMLEHTHTWARGVPEGLQERLPLLPLADPDEVPWPIADW